MRCASWRLLLAVLLQRTSAQLCHYAASRSLLRVKQECQRLGMSMYFWWDDAIEQLAGQLCVLQCPDGLISHQMQCVLPMPPGWVGLKLGL
ncbi:hypothetical protein AK812_SmicGene33893 [Symbiodinium microadriaticum]|uniref:Secreted protein n=1 Tax=Symbiodinium microadriaticum TaxID=2951 RepID=A0A1Q9CQF4_SYMMI|nr:hypothetical protein AK812_SmicGene33893 [Symbiodinium microadriaticum]